MPALAHGCWSLHCCRHAPSPSIRHVLFRGGRKLAAWYIRLFVADGATGCGHLATPAWPAPKDTKSSERVNAACRDLRRQQPAPSSLLRFVRPGADAFVCFPTHAWPVPTASGLFTQAAVAEPKGLKCFPPRGDVRWHGAPYARKYESIDLLAISHATRSDFDGPTISRFRGGTLDCASLFARTVVASPFVDNASKNGMRIRPV